MKPCLLAALMLILPHAAGPALAGGMPCQPSVTAEANSVLDTLFSALKREPNEKAAQRISGRIWAEWLKSGSDTVDLLVSWSQEAVRRERYEIALDLLDQAIALRPDHAEVWNRRATLHFTMNRHDKSMADIACTLLLEPRHFGAWSGMALIYRNAGMKAKALEAYLKVLEFYPASREAQKAAAELAEELAESAI
jgi:tetratricopeptide (TPR) repeat protein